MAATRSSSEPNRRPGTGAAISLMAGNFRDPAPAGTNSALSGKGLQAIPRGRTGRLGGREGNSSVATAKYQEIIASDRHTASPPPSAQYDRQLRRFSRRRERDEPVSGALDGDGCGPQRATALK